MTSTIDNTIDELMRRVKQRAAVGDFAFVAAYPPRPAPFPIGKYTVTAHSSGVKAGEYFIGDRVRGSDRGALYQTQLRLRVYAPAKTSGGALLRASALLADALERSDCDRIVQSIELGAIGYDDSIRSLYRDVDARLCLVLSEEAEHD